MSARSAAAMVNVPVTTVYNWHRRGWLKAVSSGPLRFSKTAVLDAAGRHEKVKDCDVPIVEIPGQIVRPERGPRDMLTRVKSVIRILGIPTYKRTGRNRHGAKRALTCVHRAQLPAIVARSIEADEQAADELSVDEGAREFRCDFRTLKSKLSEHAPKAGREITRLTRAGRRRKFVFPRAAIEAALRGETWNPADTSMPGPSQPATPLPSTPTMQTVARETAAPREPKRKGGRKRQWLPHEEWLDEHEATIAAGCSPKLLNIRLARDCNDAFESHRAANPRKYPRISPDQMKELRSRRRKRGET